MVKHLVLIILLAVPSFAGQLVAVLEAVAQENVPVNYSEKFYVTDKLRQAASRELANKGFVVMTRENVNVLLNGKSLEECEGSCAVETGRNMKADYVAHTNIGQFGENLTLTMQLYEVVSGKLVGSFTLQEKDMDALADKVEPEAGPVFRKILRENETDSKFFVGVGDVEYGEQEFEVTGKPWYIVDFSVDTQESQVSIGAQTCQAPCVLEMQDGSYPITVKKRMYLSKDTILNVSGKNATMQVRLEKNTGIVDVDPVLAGGFVTMADVDVDFDGNRMKIGSGKFELESGTHRVELNHRCYESVTTTINMSRGEVHRFAPELKIAMATLNIVAGTEDALNAPIFVDGVKMGKVPFTSEVPVCAKVEIGKDRELLPAELAAGKITLYTYNRSFVDPRDGQRYKTVKIGNQTWMAQNLNYKTNDSYCYNNDEDMCKKYGRLYEWDAAKRACPSGWHLPSEQEFETLREKAGGYGNGGKILKSKFGWNSNGNGTDSLGFSALPAGGFDSNFDVFFSEGDSAYFWSSTENSDVSANSLYIFDSNVLVDNYEMTYGLSVRCLQGSNEGGEYVLPKVVKGSMNDSRDGRKYKTVTIGNQTWMAENLNYKTSDSYCYNDDYSMCKKYGRLYTWSAAKKACPSGWHLPNSGEWNVLWTAVGGNSTAGAKLKSKSGWPSIGGLFNSNGADSFGFAVLPAGYRYSSGFFDGEGESAGFWSSTEDSSNEASSWDFHSVFGDDIVGRSHFDKDYGSSVRCLRN